MLPRSRAQALPGNAPSFSSPHSRAGRAGRNSLFNFAAVLYPTALTLIMTPVVLHYVGAEGFGTFAVASAFVGFLAVLDFGMGPATIRFVSEHVARGDFERARQVVRASLLVYSGVGFLGCALAAFLGSFLVTSVFHVRPSHVAEARFVFMVAGLGFFLTMMQSALAAIPPALQRYDITSLVSIGLTTGTTVATFVALGLGFGLRGMVVVASTQPLFAFFIYTYFGRRLLGHLRPLPLWDRVLLREVTSFSFFAFLGNAAGMVLFQFDKILLASLGTMRQVSYYVVPSNIAQRIHLGASSLNAVVLPASTALATATDFARLRRLYLLAVRFTALFVATVAVPSLILSHEILRQWVGAELAMRSDLTLKILITTYGLLALAVPAYFIALGYNRPRLTAIFNGAMATVNVPLVLMLVPHHGANGAAVAYFVSVLPLIGFVLYVERRVLHLERSPWRDVFLRLALPIAGEAICLLLLRGHVSALPSLVGLLCLSIAAMPLAYLCLLAPAEDRRIMRELFGAPRWAGSSSNVMPPILFRIVWPLTWPIRLYLRWMPVKRGTQRLYRALDRFIRSVGTGTFRAVLPRGRLAELRFDEVVGRTYLIRGAFEAGESELLHRYAKVGTTAIDVGANVGLLTMALADGVGNRGCVWAFEPFAENFDRLRQNMSLNGFEHVEVFQCAVSDSDNGAWLNVADDPAYHSLAGVQEDRATGDQIKVATTTLDDTWRARKCPFVSVIKIDTEGTEPTVVAGALALITNCKPVLVVETLSGSAAGAVGELLRPYGYAEVRSLHVQRITRVFSPRAVVCVASSEIVEPRSENGQRGTPQTCAS